VIFYLQGDHAKPSWGLGMIYEHVRLLDERGWDACVLHEQAPFRPAWLEARPPLRYLDDPALAPTAEDLLIVPEVLASHPAAARHPWRRVVFVQGGFLIVAGLAGAPDYAALGYEAAMVVMPHLRRIVERFFAARAEVVPPFVAPYFFARAPRPRERRVLLVVKDGYREAGLPDHAIAQTLLRREIERHPGWRLETLAGLDHRQAAERMQSSLFLVNVNSLEAFNTTVPEAMAAGCVPLCYPAMGGRDFLRDGENALVFNDHDVFALVARLGELMDDVDAAAPLLDRLREGGRRTAASYSPRATADALERFLANLGCTRA
jgi:glycosyltransferase involved in cell wall biosynthesis